jgi:hypothetical protein
MNLKGIFSRKNLKGKKQDGFDRTARLHAGLYLKAIEFSITSDTEFRQLCQLRDTLLGFLTLLTDDSTANSFPGDLEFKQQQIQKATDQLKAIAARMPAAACAAPPASRFLLKA